MKNLLLLLTLWLVLPSAVEASEAIPASRITVVYPKDGATISAASTFLIGAVTPPRPLSLNGAAVKLSKEGYFAQVVSLQAGSNELILSADKNPEESKRIIINREAPPVVLTSGGALQFVDKSIEPAEDMGLVPGDLLALAVRATPDNHVTAVLGNRRIVLRQPGGGSGSALNQGLDTAYGVTFQRLPAHLSDYYVGFYKIQSEDRFHNLKIKFILSGKKGSVHLQSSSAISVISQPLLSHTVHDDTVVRLGPGQARTTPLVSGVHLLIDGWQGSSMRCLLSPAHHVWIAKDDLLVDGPGPAPSAVVRTINVSEDASGARILIPLSQRLPYQIEQHLNPNSLVLKLFGATSDTDWITPPSPIASRHLIEQVLWKQPADHLYLVTVHLSNKRQWGFWVSYEGTVLVLHIKRPPATLNGMLNGIKICLDPGHGGDETGATGPSGVHESQVTLSIAKFLRELLHKEGAEIIMTRVSDQENPSLKARQDMAIAHGADLLISIHCNALPDGRDPWSEHGTSSYWYQPQAMELAKTLKDALSSRLEFPDFGVFYQNLALTRPSNMPAVLVETGFMINPDEYAQLISPAVQRQAAEGLLAGIKTYLSMPP